MLVFDHSRQGRRAHAQAPPPASTADLPVELLRGELPLLPEVSELDALRHYTRLSQKNFSIDTHFYPLGSCTMKYNPRACNALAMLPEFLGRHPLAPAETGQGYLRCMHELQEMLQEVTGMEAVSLAPMAGAQGEFAGVAMIRAYHRARADDARSEIIVPDAAHGTNPATATMCGYTVTEVPTDREGNVDLDALTAALKQRDMGLIMDVVPNHMCIASSDNHWWNDVLENGRIVMEDTCERLREKEDIREFYLGMKEAGVRGERRWKKKKMWR